MTLQTQVSIEDSIRTPVQKATTPIIALGSGVTLAATLNVLHRSGIPVYTLCPQSDFVRHSRWYRPLATPLANPRPSDLEPLLQSLDLETAVLLPCSDDWLRAVAALPEELAKRFPCSTSAKCVELLTDKWQFAQLLQRFAVLHPQTCLISSQEQFQALPDSLLDGAILKPLSSVDFATQYGVKGYLTSSREQAALRIAELELPIMLQEFIPGPPEAGYFLDGFRDREGRITAMFARRRLRMYPARLGNSTLIESIPLRTVHGALFPLQYLLEQIAYRGIFSAEFKFDERDRSFKLIEINARPWWYVEFASLCGVDVCTMAYRDALGLPVTAIHTYEVGRRCVFAVNDLRGWKEQGKNSFTGLWSVLQRWFFSDSTPFHWNDPGPGLHYLRQTAAAFVRMDARQVPAPIAVRPQARRPAKLYPTSTESDRSLAAK